MREHDRHCLAAVIIAAVENLRDADRTTDVQFRLAVDGNGPDRQTLLQVATGYLADGLMACRCQDPLAHVPQNVADEADRLLARWRFAMRQVSYSDTAIAWSAEQHAYDELIDFVEANGLNYSEHDPRGQVRS
jgi:hypothetical protein